jgi:hypothetical protein
MPSLFPKISSTPYPFALFGTVKKLDEWVFMFKFLPWCQFFYAIDCLCMFLTLHLQDVSNLTNFMTNTIGLTPDDKQLSVSGRNWGEVDLDGLFLFLSFLGLAKIT